MINHDEIVNNEVFKKFSGPFNNKEFYPEDWSLAITKDLEVDSKILEIYRRFYNFGWIESYGDQCFLMSDLLRRILRIHGIEAHYKEMIFSYSNPKKQWHQIVGAPFKITHKGVIDTHRVVVVNNLILDWAHRDSIFRPCGAMSPRAFIGIKNQKEEQDFGFFGRGRWISRTTHEASRNFSILHKDEVRNLIKIYFSEYQV